MDQIEVDLDQNEIEEIERIMRGQKMNGMKEDRLQNNQMEGTGSQNGLDLQDLIVDTPPSDFGFNENEDGEMMEDFDHGDSKKMKKLEQ